MTIGSASAARDTIFAQRDNYIFNIGAEPAPRRFEALRWAFAKHYLQAPFVGRDSDFKQLDEWLNRSATSGPRLGLLTAPAGRGKSALVTRWVDRLRTSMNSPVIFIPVSSRFHTNGSDIVLPALAVELATVLNVRVELPAVGAVEAYCDIITDLLSQFDRSGHDCLLLIDGADETLVAGWELGQALLPARPPERLRILVTARPLAGDVGASGWRYRLGWSAPGIAVTEFELNMLTLNEVTDLLDRLVADAPRHPPDMHELVQQIFRLSDEGDPLLVELYAADVQDALNKGEDVKAISHRLYQRNRGLWGYFEAWMKERDHSSGAFAVAEATLVLLASALGPIHHADLIALLQRVLPGASIPPKTDLLAPLSRFVIGDGDLIGYTLGHPRFGVFLQEEQYAGTPLLEHADRAFLTWGENVLAQLQSRQRTPVDVPAYVLTWFPRHVLRQTDNPGPRLAAFLSNAWIEACRHSSGEVDFALVTQSILDTLLKLLDRPGNPNPDQLATALRASLILASLRDASRFPNTRLFVLAFEHGVLDLNALLARQTLLDPVARVELLLQLAMVKRPEIDAMAVWRQARDIVSVAPAEAQVRLYLMILAASQRLCAQASSAAQMVPWEEIRAFIERLLAVSSAELLGSSPYRDLCHRSQLSADQLDDLTRMALDGSVLPALRSVLFWDITYGFRRNEPQSLITVLERLINDGRRGRIARSMITVLKSSLHDEPEPKTTMETALSHCKDQDERIQAMAALLGVLVASFASPAIIQDLALLIEAEAGPVTFMQLIFSGALIGARLQIPNSVFARIWTESAKIARDHERLRVRAGLLDMLADKRSVSLLVSEELHANPYDLFGLVRSAAPHLSAEQRCDLLSKLAASKDDDARIRLLDELIQTADDDLQASLRREFAPRLKRQQNELLNDRDIQRQVGAMLSEWPRTAPTLAELDRAHELTRKIYNGRNKANLLSQLVHVAPDARKPLIITEALEAAGGIDDREACVQAMASLAEYLAPDAADRALNEALTLLRNIDPQSAIHAVCNVARRLPQEARTTWASFAIEVANRIAPGTVERGRAMARVVNTYKRAASFAFVRQSLRVASHTHDDQAEVGWLYRDLIFAPIWAAWPAIWQVVRMQRQLPPTTRAHALSALISRYPRLFFWLRGRAWRVIQHLEDEQDRFNRAVELVRSDRGSRRNKLAAKAVDVFAALLQAQEENSTNRYLSQSSSIRFLYECSDKPTRERIRQSVQSCQDEELRLYYDVCLFPALLTDERAELGMPLLRRIEDLAQRNVTSVSTGRQFNQLQTVFRYWNTPWGIKPLLALLRAGAQVSRRTWFYSLPDILHGLPPELRQAVSGTVLQDIKDSVLLWP